MALFSTAKEYHTYVCFNLTKECKTGSFIHRPGQVCFDDLIKRVSLSSQTRQVDLRLGYVGLSISLALTGGVLRQPDLRGVLPSHGAQIGLC